jgi:hypothetical protein
MLLYRHQNAGQNRDIKIANRSSENVSQFKYSGTTVTSRTLIQEEIKRRLSSVMLANIQSRVFPSFVNEFKNENIQDYNFACDFVWVRNLVSGTKGGT